MEFDWRITYIAQRTLAVREVNLNIVICLITPPSGRGLVIPAFLLFSIFLVVTCPRPPVFTQPNILVASFATQARACILSDHNLLHPEGRGNGGVMPLGLFLFN